MFVGEGGVGALHRQMGSQKDWIEQWRDTCWEGPKKKPRCWTVGTPRRSRNAAKRTATGVRAAYNIELGGRE